ncbi:hypothetical protein NDU88_011736 [Pleurodeles waltl]|uniref:Uncharacterized protein n=1 Tax=Pleurodeles waltl TaxID=8319 RepID=A0AAV7R1W7_PLEWA|nr:hypothetical protein NDU88_011736 [Pleurodeles waltl]
MWSRGLVIRRRRIKGAAARPGLVPLCRAHGTTGRRGHLSPRQGDLGPGGSGNPAGPSRPSRAPLRFRGLYVNAPGSKKHLSGLSCCHSSGCLRRLNAGRAAPQTPQGRVAGLPLFQGSSPPLGLLSLLRFRSRVGDRTPGQDPSLGSKQRAPPGPPGLLRSGPSRHESTRAGLSGSAGLGSGVLLRSGVRMRPQRQAGGSLGGQVAHLNLSRGANRRAPTLPLVSSSAGASVIPLHLLSGPWQKGTDCVCHPVSVLDGPQVAPGLNFFRLSGPRESQRVGST